MGSGVRKPVGFLGPTRYAGWQGGLLVWLLRIGQKELPNQELLKLPTTLYKPGTFTCEILLII